jgi:hypothetical protein
MTDETQNSVPDESQSQSTPSETPRVEVQPETEINLSEHSERGLQVFQYDLAPAPERPTGGGDIPPAGNPQQSAASDAPASAPPADTPGSGTTE